METRFGHDFSNVRVHTDSQASAAAGALHARAFSIGRDLVFREGEYAPGTNPGRSLLAHELAHVVQRSGTSDSFVSELEVTDPRDVAEAEAGRAAEHSDQGRPVSIRSTLAPKTVGRFVSEALIAAGEAALALDVEAAPVEAVTGPPGWLTAAGLAIAGGLLIGAGVLISSDEPEQKLNAMRFQVQWNTNRGGPTFSRVAVAPGVTGVTTSQAIIALNAAVDSVEPRAAKDAAAPAHAKQVRWIESLPPAGISIGGYSRSQLFRYQNYPDARVDVENLRGHNCKV